MSYGHQIKVLDHGFVTLVDCMPAMAVGAPPKDFGPGDQRVVDAARVCIAGENVRATSESDKLIGYLLKNQHSTPFEQVRFTYLVKAPILVARQWFRHRMGSYNEMSARYGELPGEFYIPDPERMASQATTNKQGSGALLEEPARTEAREILLAHSERSYAEYQRLLKLGLARELARSVLPVNIYTQWYWTTDLRNLMHFLGLRLDGHAQYEIRVYAEALLTLARPLAPCTFRYFEASLKK